MILILFGFWPSEVGHMARLVISHPVEDPTGPMYLLFAQMGRPRLPGYIEACTR